MRRSARSEARAGTNLFWCIACFMILFCMRAMPAVAQATAPVAVAGPDISAVVAVPVIIDGSKSHDPGGQLITFRWTIADAPSGSMATLDVADPAPVFVPDIAGTYLLQLVVSNQDGTASAPSTMALVAVATSPFPNARAGKNRRAVVGSRVDLDAGMSFDPMDRPLTYRWALVSAPKASRVDDASIMLRDSARPWFTPDAAGTYVLRLEASNGDRVAEDRVVVTAATGNLAPIADPGWFQYIERRGPVALDGTASVDPDAGPAPLAFAWSLVARPPDSALTDHAIVNANTANAGVTPDVDGAYVFRLTVTDGVASDADNVLVRQSTVGARDAREAAVRGGAAVNATPGGSTATNADGRKQLANFALQVHPIVLNVAAGGQGAVTISLLAPSSSAGAARLDVTGLPRGVIATFGTQILASGASTLLTLRADAGAPVGRHPLRITATAIASASAATSWAALQLNVTAENLEAGRGVSCAGLTGDVKTAIYVAPYGKDSASCGRTAELPCASIQRGIDNCTQAGCGVLVRHGLYRTTATISLKDGVSIFGSCSFDGAPDENSTAAKYRTVIEATPAPGSPALNADGINRPTVVAGLVIVGKDETETGVSGIASIVMVASHSRGITMFNSTLVAGKGGPGVPGRSFPGGPGGPGVRSGQDFGGAGGQACPSTPPNDGRGSGGAGGYKNYFQVDYGGCNYTCDCTSLPNSVGKPGQDSGPVKGGGGGAIGGAGCGCARVDGVPAGVKGTPGNPGSCSNQGGKPGSLFGSFQGAKWIASAGGTGIPGAVGSGGGGGGAGGPSVNSDTNYSQYAGESGGGGGGGGCGGPGGTGGGQGGASIALVLVNSAIAGVPEGANSLVPGPGGPGGKGGAGGEGGAGGRGANGDPSTSGYWWISPNVCSTQGTGAGGPGGDGGRGGPGAGGAGGNGGPSLGIALVAGSPNPGTRSGIYAGLPGAAGAKGVGGFGDQRPQPCNGADGDNGVTGGSAAIWDAKS
jgi:hypothetical protein